jgi:hypothetical protein
MDLHEGMEGNEHHECGLSAAELMYMTTAQETLIGGVTHTADAHVRYTLHYTYYVLHYTYYM